MFGPGSRGTSVSWLCVWGGNSSVCVCVRALFFFFFFSKVVSVYVQDPGAMYVTLYVSPLLFSFTVNLIHFIYSK